MIPSDDSALIGRGKIGRAKIGNDDFFLVNESNKFLLNELERFLVI